MGPFVCLPPILFWTECLPRLRNEASDNYIADIIQQRAEKNENIRHFLWQQNEELQELGVSIHLENTNKIEDDTGSVSWIEIPKSRKYKNSPNKRYRKEEYTVANVMIPELVIKVHNTCVPVPVSAPDYRYVTPTA